MKTTILLINGVIGAGKDTSADYIAQHLKEHDKSIKVYCVRFADKLKEWAEQMSGIQRKILPYEHYNDVVVDFTHEQKETFLPLWGMTLRQLLQKFATEGCRDGFDPHIWCKLLAREVIEQIKHEQSFAKEVETDRVVFLVPDFRFSNEPQLIEYVKAEFDELDIEQITCHIDRPANDKEQSDHRSEKPLSIQFDTHINNEFGLLHLVEECYRVANIIIERWE